MNRSEMISCSTREKIKEAFLEAVAESSFLDVRITNICKKAKIHRSTFYTYYEKKEDVLNELLYEAFGQIDTYKNQLKEKNGEDCKLPMCIFMRKAKRYHPLFRDLTLSEYVIGKMVLYFKDEYERWEIRTEDRTAVHHDDVGWFQMYGCYHMTVKYLDASPEVWERKKKAIDQFIANGLSDSTY